MKNLICCCCGDQSGEWEQFHNRDTGFGICKPCIERIRTHRPFGREPMSETEIARTYGIEGVNWGETHFGHRVPDLEELARDGDSDCKYQSH